MIGKSVVRSVLLAAVAGTSLGAADSVEHYWPTWRGPLDSGVAPHAEPPTSWGEDRNVRLKIPIPGRGLSSPVVWGDTVFVMTSVAADEKAYAASQKAAAEVLERKEWPPAVEPVEQRFVLLALSRKDGSVLWERTATQRVPHEAHYIDSSWSAASPVTDGKRVIAHFGSNGTHAYDMDGKPLWDVDLGDMRTRRSFGEGSSPALHGDMLVINWDHEGDSFIVALDARNGKMKWKVERPDEVTSWSTPLVVKHAKRHQVIVPATGRSRGYDLATGRELWRLGGMTVNTIPTALHDDGVVYLTSGYRGNMLQAVDLASASGDLEGTESVLWTHERDTPYVATPVLYEGRLYFVKHFKNILTVVDAGSGKPHYTERLPGMGSIWSSPVAAAGRIYLFDRKGHAVVLKDGPTLDVLAENDLDEGADATPALVDGEIWLRTTGHLYRIESGD
jgi:outer membrane protein assembly factor BamB